MCVTSAPPRKRKKLNLSLFRRSPCEDDDKNESVRLQPSSPCMHDNKDSRRRNSNDGICRSVTDGESSTSSTFDSATTRCSLSTSSAVRAGRNEENCHDHHSINGVSHVVPTLSRQPRHEFAFPDKSHSLSATKRHSHAKHDDETGGDDATFHGCGHHRVEKNDDNNKWTMPTTHSSSPSGSLSVPATVSFVIDAGGREPNAPVLSSGEATPSDLGMSNSPPRGDRDSSSCSPQYVACGHDYDNWHPASMKTSAQRSTTLDQSNFKKDGHRRFVKHDYHDHSLDSDELYLHLGDESAAGGGGKNSLSAARLDKKTSGPLLVGGGGTTENKGDITQQHYDGTNICAGRKKGGVAVPFPIKLHIMLDQIDRKGTADIVSWQPHGRAFVVHKPKEFVRSVMPRYFRQSKLTSFQRQLNLYGFSRITRGKDCGGYYHELFLRGRPLLCWAMKRMKIKGTGFKAASSPETEPNFYDMPPVYGDARFSIDFDYTSNSPPFIIPPQQQWGPAEKYLPAFESPLSLPPEHEQTTWATENSVTMCPSQSCAVSGRAPVLSKWNITSVPSVPSKSRQTAVLDTISMSDPFGCPGSYSTPAYAAPKQCKDRSFESLVEPKAVSLDVCDDSTSGSLDDVSSWGDGKSMDGDESISTTFDPTNERVSNQQEERTAYVPNCLALSPSKSFPVPDRIPVLSTRNNRESVASEPSSGAQRASPATSTSCKTIECPGQLFHFLDMNTTSFNTAPHHGSNKTSFERMERPSKVVSSNIHNRSVGGSKGDPSSWSGDKSMDDNKSVDVSSDTDQGISSQLDGSPFESNSPWWWSSKCTYDKAGDNIPSDTSSCDCSEIGEFSSWSFPEKAAGIAESSSSSFRTSKEINSTGKEINKEQGKALFPIKESLDMLVDTCGVVLDNDINLGCLLDKAVE